MKIACRSALRFSRQSLRAGIAGCACESGEDWKIYESKQYNRDKGVNMKPDRLVEAAKNGNLKGAEKAIRKGGDMAMALMWASKLGHTEIATLLIENGVDI
jgi:hypothetical protein